MLSVKQLLYWTKLHRAEILKKARRVSVRFGKAEEITDNGATFRQVTARAVGDTVPRNIVLRFRGTGATSKAWVSCDCEYFKFHCEVADTRRGSSDVIHSNGKFPKITNKRGVAHVCKHIAACFLRGAQDLAPKRKSAVDKVKEKRKSKTRNSNVERERGKLTNLDQKKLTGLK